MYRKVDRREPTESSNVTGRDAASASHSFPNRDAIKCVPFLLYVYEWSAGLGRSEVPRENAGHKSRKSVTCELKDTGFPQVLPNLAVYSDAVIERETV